MDDFYKECREKVQNAADPAAAIDELAAISLQDLPQVQICKFVEQAVALLSIIFQSATCPAQNMVTKFKQIRRQLEMTLDYMERIMEAEKEFPSHQQSDGCWW